MRDRDGRKRSRKGEYPTSGIQHPLKLQLSISKAFGWLTFGWGGETLREIMKSKVLAALVQVVVLVAAPWGWNLARAAETFVPFEGEKSSWHDGFDRYDFVMDEASLAIKPFKAPEGEKVSVGEPANGQRPC